MPPEAIHALEYVSHLSYIGIFIAVALSGYVIPIPEEIILILGGYFAAQHITFLPLVMVAGVLGAIAGDNVIFYLAGHGSHFTKKYHKRVESTHLGWYMRHMKKSPMKTIFFSRFIVGMRFFNPLVSGLMGIKWRKFFVASALSALIYIPFVMFLGYIWSRQIDMLLRVAVSVRHYIIIALVTATIIALIAFIRNLISRE